LINVVIRSTFADDESQALKAEVKAWRNIVNYCHGAHRWYHARWFVHGIVDVGLLTDTDRQLG
jgi:hypothetical protein